MVNHFRSVTTVAIPLVLIMGVSPRLRIGDSSELHSPRLGEAADSLRHLFRNPHSGFASALRAVVMDSTNFRRLWAEAVNGVPEAPVMPRIDFARSMVIVAGMGGQPTTGFAIAIDSVVVQGSSVEVHVTLGSGNLCVQGQAFTSPVDIVEVPLHVGVVVFRDRHVVQQCRVP